MSILADTIADSFEGLDPTDEHAKDAAIRAVETYFGTTLVEADAPDTNAPTNGIHVAVLDDGEQILHDTYASESEVVTKLYRVVGDHARRRGDRLKPETDDLDQVVDACRELGFDVYVERLSGPGTRMDTLANRLTQTYAAKATPDRWGIGGWCEESDECDDGRPGVWNLPIGYMDGQYMPEGALYIIHRDCDGEYPITGAIARNKMRLARGVVEALNLREVLRGQAHVVGKAKAAFDVIGSDLTLGYALRAIDEHFGTSYEHALVLDATEIDSALDEMADEISNTDRKYVKSLSKQVKARAIADAFNEDPDITDAVYDMRKRVVMQLLDED